VALFLDTSVVIDFLRNGEFASALIAREPLYTSPITVHETLSGMRGSEEARTVRLLDGLIVVPLGCAEAALSAHWRRDYATKGVTLSPEDTLIAASAFLQDLPLATGNAKDFPMIELRVEEWSAEGS
jgi:predicted nucleic acid-binding protein